MTNNNDELEKLTPELVVGAISVLHSNNSDEEAIRLLNVYSKQRVVEAYKDLASSLAERKPRETWEAWAWRVHKELTDRIKELEGDIDEK